MLESWCKMTTKITNENDYKKKIIKIANELPNNPTDIDLNFIKKKTYITMLDLYKYERIMASSEIEIKNQIKTLEKNLIAKTRKLKLILSKSNKNPTTINNLLAEYSKQLIKIRQIKYNPTACKNYIATLETPLIVEIKKQFNNYHNNYNKQYLLMLGSIVDKGNKEKFIDACKKYNIKSSTSNEYIKLNINNLDIFNDIFFKINFQTLNISKEDIKKLFDKNITNITDLDTIKDYIERIKYALDELNNFTKKYFNTTMIKELLKAKNISITNNNFFTNSSIKEIINHFNHITSFIDKIYYEDDFLDDNYNFYVYSAVKDDIILLKKNKFKYLLNPKEKIKLCIKDC